MSTDDEVLESSPRRLPRWTWLVLVLAVVVAGAVFAFTRGGDDTPRAAPTTSVAPTTTAAVATVPRTVCLDVGDSPLNCGVSAAIPRPVVVATQAVLPGAAVVSATTVTGRDGRVFSRRVLVRDPRGSELSVRISAANRQQGGSSVIGLDDGRSVQYGTDVGRRHVAISVQTVRGESTPPVDALQKLALDARLFTVG